MKTRCAWSKNDKSPVLTPRHVRIAELRLQGLTMEQIANELGDITKSGVSNALRRQPVKKLLEDLRDRLVDTALEKAVNNISSVIASFQDEIPRTKDGKPDREALQRREHGFIASLKIMEGANLLPSRKSNGWVKDAGNSTVLNQCIRKLIAAKLAETDTLNTPSNTQQ